MLPDAAPGSVPMSKVVWTGLNLGSAGITAVRGSPASEGSTLLLTYTLKSSSVILPRHVQVSGGRAEADGKIHLLMWSREAKACRLVDSSIPTQANAFARRGHK